MSRCIYADTQYDNALNNLVSSRDNENNNNKKYDVTTHGIPLFIHVCVVYNRPDICLYYVASGIKCAFPRIFWFFIFCETFAQCLSDRPRTFYLAADKRQYNILCVH